MAVKLKDVAEKAKVSLASASLVLNGKPGISEETRSRVLSAARELKYKFKAGQRGIGGEGGTLAFLKIATHGHTVNRDHNVFLSDYVDGLSEEAERLGYRLEINAYEKVNVEDIVSQFKDRKRPGGMIILGTELDERDIRLFQGLDLPLVVIDSYSDYIDCNFVDMNNTDAVFKVLSYFVEAGFRRIGMIGSEVGTTNFALRRVAFVEGMRNLGLELQPGHLLNVDSTYQGAYEDMRTLLRTGISLPESYFCANDIISYGCIKAFREFGVRIPQDLSLVGFDNLPMSSQMDPPLSSVEVSKKSIGRLAVSLLDQRIRVPGPQASVKVLVGAHLVLRKSVLAKSRAESTMRREPGVHAT